MADTRFFHRPSSHSLAEIASASECVLADPTLGSLAVDDVAALQDAGSQHLSFLDNPKYRDAFRVSKAGACIVSADMAKEAPKGMAVLISKAPYRSYAMAAALFYPFPKGQSAISPKAVIDDTATIGANVRIEANSVIGAGVVIGDDSWIGPNVTLTHCVVGRHVRIHSGVRVGQDGFGFALGAKGHLPVPQLGRVLIEDGVNIGANTCIDRGAGPDTVIGAGSVIDNLVQIAHNVKIGRGCVIAAQVGISGSSVLGDGVVLGGQVGIAGHLHIGSGARVAAQSGVTKDIPAGEEWVGFPAAPRLAYWREVASIKKLLSKTLRKG